MSVKSWIFAAVAVGGLAYIYNQRANNGQSGQARQVQPLECIQKKESPYTPGMYDYTNRCNVSLVVEVCKTLVAGDLMQMFGVKKEPMCTTDTHKPGEMIAFAMDNDSNLLTSVISTSSMAFRACFEGQRIQIRSDGKYLCQTP